MVLNHEIIWRILPCFFDMPLQDACRAMHLSPHSIRKVMNKNGVKGWPFQKVKKNMYHLKWWNIEEARDMILQTHPGEEIYNALMKAKSIGWLMRRIHDDSFSIPKSNNHDDSFSIPKSNNVNQSASLLSVIDNFSDQPASLLSIADNSSEVRDSLVELENISDWTFLDDIMDDDSVRAQLAMIDQESEGNYWDGLFD